MSLYAVTRHFARASNLNILNSLDIIGFVDTLKEKLCRLSFLIYLAAASIFGVSGRLDLSIFVVDV